MSPGRRDLCERYAALAPPRPAAYPPPELWEAGFPADRRLELVCATLAPGRRVALHIRADERPPAFAAPFLEGVALELEHLAALDSGAVLSRLSISGGATSWLSPRELDVLLKLAAEAFPRAFGAELIVELGANETPSASIAVLAAHSVHAVKAGLARPPFALGATVTACRAAGIAGLHLDLADATPTARAAQAAVAAITALAPTRVTSLAAPPDAQLPAIRRLLSAGYQLVGTDAFAQPDDALARGLDDGTITRGIDGPAVGRDLPVLGVGPSAVTALADAYVQNPRELERWRRVLASGLAHERGILLSADDRLRRAVINDLHCYRTVSKASFKAAARRSFDEYFAARRAWLDRCAKDGLVRETAGALTLTRPLGELLSHAVTAAFDRYLPQSALKDVKQPASAVS